MKNRISAITLTSFLVLSSVFSIPVKASENTWTEARKNFESALALEVDPKTGKAKYQDSDSISITVALKENNKAINKLKDDHAKNNQINSAQDLQSKVLDRLKKEDIDIKITRKYSLVLNGFSGKTSVSDAKELAMLPEVKSISLTKVYNQPKVNQVVSQNLPGPDRDENKYGKYTGEKKIVAVLDSGIDHEHPDFKLTNPSNAIYPNEEAIKKVKDQTKTRPGKYLSSKIPFAYNYMDYDTLVKDTKNNMHGQHVSGIIGANGKIKGIAPEAQILCMRVFSNATGQTTSEAYINALEDAIKLKADSINMSLGAPSGSISAQDEALIKAIKGASDIGALVNVSAGNEGHFGYTVSNPLAINPDYGVVATPSIAPDALSVASMETSLVMYKKAVLDYGNQKFEFPYEPQTEKEFDNNSYEFVYGEYGDEDEINKIKDQLKGKVALIQRGKKIPFNDKARRAQEAGATGIIFYNDKEHGDDFISVKLENITIPVIFIGHSQGEKLRTNSTGKVTITKEESNFTNPTVGKMSSFSSWGISADQDAKPEITAYGGKIYSTLNDKKYGTMSGTSMSAPKVSGAVVLLAQKIEETYPDVKNSKKHELIKTILMNTATPHLDKTTNQYTSPRKQGAGILNIGNALNAKAIIVGKDNKAFINLKDINNKISFSAKVKNLSGDKLKYKVKLHVTTDQVENDKFTLHPQHVATIDLPSIELDGKQEKEIKVDYDNKDKHQELINKMPSGYFLDGFLILSPENGDDQELSLPFVGFNGKFADLNIIEKSIYDLSKENKLPTYYENQDEKPEEQRLNNFTHFDTEIDNKRVVLGYNSEQSKKNKPVYNKLVISPNGDGKADAARFVGTFLRNFKNLTMSVYEASDVNKTKPSKITKDALAGVKNFHSGNPQYLRSSTSLLWTWGGTYQNLIKDGKYVVEVAVDSVVEGGKTQKQYYDIEVDTIKPQVHKASYDQNTRTFKIEKTFEEGSGIWKTQVILPDGKEIKASADNTYVLPENADLNKIIVKLTDYGYNTSEDSIQNAIEEGEFGRFKIRFKTNDGSLLPTFKYKVLDEHNQEVKNPDKVKLGKYKIEITDLHQRYVIADQNELTNTIDKSGESKDWVINFKELPSTTLFVKIDADYNYRHLDDLKISARNIETNEVIFEEKGSVAIYRMIKVPYGKYKIEVSGVEENYSYTIKPDGVIECYSKFQDEKAPKNIVQITKANAKVKTIAKFDDNSNHDNELKYKAVNKETNQEYDLPGSLLPGKYEIYPIVIPKDYFIENPYQEIEIKEETKEVTATFEFKQVTQGWSSTKSKGSLYLNDYQKLPEELKETLKLEVVDITGKVVHTFDDLKQSWISNVDLLVGSYKIRPKRGTFDSEKFKLNIFDNNQEVTRFNISGGSAKYITLKASKNVETEYELVGKPQYEAAHINNVKTPIILKLRFTKIKNNQQTRDVVEATYQWNKESKIKLLPGVYQVEELESSDARYHLLDRKQEIRITSNQTIELPIQRDRADILSYIEHKPIEIKQGDKVSLPTYVVTKLENALDITNNKGQTKMPVIWEKGWQEKIKQPGEYIIKGTYNLDKDLIKMFTNSKNIQPIIKVIVGKKAKEQLEVKIEDLTLEQKEMIKVHIEKFTNQKRYYELYNIFVVNSQGQKVKPIDKIKVKVKLKQEFKNLEVYHVDKDNKLELIKLSKFDKNIVEFETDNFSPFIFVDNILISPNQIDTIKDNNQTRKPIVEENKVKDKNNSTNPSTGDDSNFIIYGIGGLIGIIGLIILIRKYTKK